MALRETQTVLAGWIRAPEGVAEALVEEDAASGCDGTGAAARRLEILIRSDAMLDATGRLEIYANAYFHRILGVLTADYPALEKTLGANRFRDLVTSYLLVEPSRHPSLRYAGSRLAEFLALHEATAGIRARAPWAPELAALEWARVDVFDVIDQPVLARESLASLSPGDFSSLVLCLGPWVALRSFEHPVRRMWASAIREKEDSAEERSGPESVLIWRNEESVWHRRVEATEAAALAEVGDGIRFEALCEWAATRLGESEAPATAAGWLGQWVADGLLVAPASSSGVSDVAAE